MLKTAFKGQKVCRIDDRTQVPEDLFFSLLKAAADRKNGGQHCLEIVGQEFGGKTPMLVHADFTIANSISKTSSSMSQSSSGASRGWGRRIQDLGMKGAVFKHSELFVSRVDSNASRSTSKGRERRLQEIAAKCTLFTHSEYMVTRTDSNASRSASRGRDLSPEQPTRSRSKQSQTRSASRSRPWQEQLRAMCLSSPSAQEQTPGMAPRNRQRHSRARSVSRSRPWQEQLAPRRGGRCFSSPSAMSIPSLSNASTTDASITSPSDTDDEASTECPDDICEGIPRTIRSIQSQSPQALLETQSDADALGTSEGLANRPRELRVTILLPWHRRSGEPALKLGIEVRSPYVSKVEL